MIKKGIILVLAALIVLSSTLYALHLNADSKSLISRDLVVYTQGIALVKEVRAVKLNKGLNEIIISDIPSQIDATSIVVKSLNSSVKVLEQSYDYDLVNYQKLLAKSIGKKIKVKIDNETIEGILLSYNHNTLVLDIDGKPEIIFTYKAKYIILQTNISEYTLKPSLRVVLEAEEPGTYLLELIYLTKGISWTPYYVIVVSSDENQIEELAGWARIVNNAGVDFENIGLSLLAGEVQTVSGETYIKPLSKAYEAEGISYPLSQFTEEKLFEYHIFKLNRRISLRDNEAKQVSFITAKNISCIKEYFVDYVRKGPKVYVAISFNNTKTNNLGVPLPKGIIRVYKNTESRPVFIGEDRIENKPANSTVRVVVGVAYDITVSRKILESRKISENTIRYKYRIVLKNYGDKTITVKVIEHAYGNWEIVDSSHSYVKVDAYTFEFKVEVPPNSEVIIEYRIIIWW